MNLRKFAVLLPLMAGGCINSIDQRSVMLPDGSTHVTVITSHITPLADAAAFSGYQCTDHCQAERAEPTSAPGIISGVAAGALSTGITTAAPFIAPRIINNIRSGDTQ